ncbi:MAG: cell division protein MraZ [Bacteroidales bacterium]|nr:cell division protein MraZ [Bacteroidales bacterium]
MGNFLEKFQSHNRAVRQEMKDEEVAIVQEEYIVKAAAAMLDAKVKEDKIKELLSKYWDIRPSDAMQFLKTAKDIYLEEQKCQTMKNRR